MTTSAQSDLCYIGRVDAVIDPYISPAAVFVILSRKIGSKLDILRVQNNKEVLL